MGIHEILNKLNHHTPLSLEKTFHTLYYQKMDKKVLEYLRNILKGLYIKITEDYEGAILSLMSAGKLEGWCWQTTESAIPFFDDNDSIERGTLQFGYGYPGYYHSWICFQFEGEEYVFDPCLMILCKKEDYYKTFLVELQGKVSAHDVKAELLKQIELSRQRESTSPETRDSQKFWERYFGDSHSREGEVVMCGPEDVNTPFYRSNVGYKAEMEKGKIKKLVAHYYYYD